MLNFFSSPLRKLFLLFFCLFSVTIRAEEFLDPLVAFRPTVIALDGQTLEVRFSIAPNYYLYREKFRFSARDINLGEAKIPKGKEKYDEAFGNVEVFYKEVAIRLPVERNASGLLSFPLKVSFQGCAEAGICYPLQTLTLFASLPAEEDAPAPRGTMDMLEKADGFVADESGRIAKALGEAGFLTNIFFFFVAGLLLAFTPCVLPMIPILSGIIAGQKGGVSRKRNFALSLSYVLGMALTYAIVGALAGLTGSLLSHALQNVWVLSVFSGLFVLLALSMFGFYDLQLPSSLQSRLSEESNQLDHHFKKLRLLAVFLTGAISALIIGPCVAAPLAGALLYIGKTGNALWGGAALFFMGLGMGIPLLLAGLSVGSLLPHTGPWMESVKKGFGVVLLASAVWILSPVIPEAAQMLAYALILIISSIYLGALDAPAHPIKGWQRFWKGMGIVMLVWGIALFLGVLGGSRQFLQPLSAFAPSGSVVAKGELPTNSFFERIASLDELENRLNEGAANQKPVLLDFYADWCITCKEMERFTFADPDIRRRMGQFTRLQVDVTANSETDKQFLKRFQLYGPPALIFFDAQGRELDGIRVVGFQNADLFGKTLEAVEKRVLGAFPPAD